MAWEEYFRLAFKEKLHPKPLADDSSALQLILEKKQEVAVTDQGLQAQRKEFRSTMESVNQRWIELAQKGQALKGSAIYFDKLRKEAEARSEVWKAIQERHRMHNLEADVLRLRAQLKELQLQRERLQRRVQRLEPCAQILEGVRKQLPQFQEVLDMVARFQVLVDTKAVLKLAEIDRHVEVEATRARLLRLREAKQVELLRLNQERIRLCEQLEAARELTQQRESKWTEIQNKASEKSLLLGRTRMAVLNLYQLVCMKQGQKQILDMEDIEGQLEEVKQFIMSVSAILASFDQPKAKPTETAS